MITAGIDVGAKTIKVVLVEDNKRLAQKTTVAGFDTVASVDQVFGETLEAVGGLSRDDVELVVGAGRGDIPLADNQVTAVNAGARGASSIYLTARTVIDVGAEEGRVVRCDGSGRVLDFAANDKCAAGAGTFAETIARALEVDLEELGRMSLRSKTAVPMNAQCTVFAESEVVSLLHAKTPKEDIARAVHDAMASRISSMVRRVGRKEDVVIIGGLARNVGFVDSLKTNLNAEILVPDEPEFVGALGAALIAADRLAEA